MSVARKLPQSTASGTLERMPAQDVFRSNVRRILERDGASISELARRAGLSRPQLNNMLNGQYHARLDTVDRIAQALNCRLAELFLDPSGS